MIRLATWNLKQAVAPRCTPDEGWAWMSEMVDPDVVVFTEAKVPRAGLPAGWSAVWDPDGLGPRRRWGTVVAGCGVEIRRLSEVTSGGRRCSIETPWPAAAFTCDVVVGGDRWATVVGIYSMLVDLEGNKRGNGFRSTAEVVASIFPLIESDRGGRLLVVGDLNLLPDHATRVFRHTPLVDLVSWTRADRSPLDGCAGCDLGDECGHLWTHRNPGGANPAHQQVDFMFAGEEIANELDVVFGGDASFPDVWDLSDHAPIVADFT